MSDRSSEAPPSALLDLLSELQALDRVPRIGYSLRGIVDPESVSEHAFHVVFLVWALAGREKDVERARAVDLALVHDLAEVRFGDLPRTAAHYLPPGAKNEAELLALADLMAPLGAEPVELLEEYQDGESVEARFVSVCDKLQLILKALVYRSWGAGSVEEFAAALESFDDGGFETVRGLVRELRRRRDQAGSES